MKKESGIGVELDKIYFSDYVDFLGDLRDGSVDLVISDVPYVLNGEETGVNGEIVELYKKDWNPYFHGKISTQFGEWDKEFSVSKYIDKVTPKVKDTGSIIIFNGFKKIEETVESLIENDWHIMGIYYWYKPNPVPYKPNRLTLSSFEQYVWAVKDKENYTFNVRERAKKRYSDELSVYETGRIRCSQFEESTKRFHTTQKPVSMWRTLVDRHSNVGDIVMDNFSGSGVNAVSCIKSYRRFIGTEIDEDYYRKSVERIEKERKKSKNTKEKVKEGENIYGN